MKSLMEFFKEEKEVFLQNIANGQVSITFATEHGTEAFLFPHSPDPVNLTNYFPWKVIKDSIDLKKMLNRHPPAIKILTDEEYNSYYHRKAQDNGLYTKQGGKKVPDVDAALELAAEERRAIMEHRPLPNAERPEPLHEVVEDDPHFGGKKRVKASEIVGEEDIINARVLHLCNQVKSELTEQERMPAQQMLTDLKQLEGELTLEDYEYVRAHGYYQSVRKWAKQGVSKTTDTKGAED